MPGWINIRYDKVNVFLCSFIQSLQTKTSFSKSQYIAEIATFKKWMITTSYLQHC